MAKVESDNSHVLLLQQKLDDHIEAFNEHCESEEARWEHLIAAQERNSVCIENLTNSTKELTNSTRDIVRAWNAASGTVQTMSALGKFVKWIGGFAFIISFIVWFLDKTSGQ